MEAPLRVNLSNLSNCSRVGMSRVAREWNGYDDPLLSESYQQNSKRYPSAESTFG